MISMRIKSFILIPGLVAAMVFSGCHEAKSEQLWSGSQQDNVPPGNEDTGEPDAPDYYVSSAEELKSIRLVPGDVVVWKDGTYDGVSVRLTASGTADAPVVFRAETPGRVVFTGASSMSVGGSYVRAEGFVWNELDTSMKSSVMILAKGSSHCSFSDCMIDGSGSRVSDVDTKWVSIYGTFNEVANCSFIDKRNMGCLMVVWMEDGIVPHHTVRNNYFTRPYTHYDDDGKARNGQESIRIGTSDYSMSDAECNVYGNWFYRCNGERAEIISSKSCGNVYSGNLFEESVGTLTLRHGNRCTVRGNIFTSGGKPDVGGVRIIGEDHVVEGNVFLDMTGAGYTSAICLVRGESDAELSGYWTVKNASVRDNVLVDCRYGVVVNYSGRSTQDMCPQNSTFQNNLIFSRNRSSYTPVYVIDTPAGEMHWLTNTIFGGKCKGIELTMTEDEPEIRDYSDDMDAIRKKAGKTW